MHLNIRNGGSVVLKYFLRYYPNFLPEKQFQMQFSILLFAFGEKLFKSTKINLLALELVFYLLMVELLATDFALVCLGALVFV